MHHPIVQFRDVTFAFGASAVLHRVSLSIPEGAFVGVVGPSGAGKTTLLKLAAGMLRPTSGEVRFGPDGVRRPVRLGLVPQIESVDWSFPVTAEEVVLMGRADDSRPVPWPRPGVRKEARGILDRLGIGELARRHIRDLSGGQQQRVFIARALIRRPDLLLLDEPTAGVDVKTRHDILHLLHELNHQGIAVVLTTHDLNAVAAHLPSLVCLNRRVIAVGTPDQILTPQVLQELYGAEMVVVRDSRMLLIGDVPGAFADEHDRAAHPEVPAAHFGEAPPPHDHGPGSDHEHPDEEARTQPVDGRR